MLPPGSGIASPEASCSSELSVNKWQGLSHNINSVQAKLVTNGICRMSLRCLDRYSIAARRRSVSIGCSHSVLSEVGRCRTLRLHNHNNSVTEHYFQHYFLPQKAVILRIKASAPFSKSQSRVANFRSTRSSLTDNIPSSLLKEKESC